MPTEDANTKLAYYRARISRCITLPENKKLLLQFDDFNKANGLKPYTRANYIREMLPFLEFLPNKNLKNVDKIKREEIAKYINQLDENYKKNTIELYKVGLIKFFRWLNKGTKPDCVAWLKYIYSNEDIVMPEDILKPEEIQGIVDAGESAMEKAIISVAFETGSRIGEFSNIKLKDIEFHETGATISVSGKTGPRVLFVYDSLPYLRAWLDTLPIRKDRESHVWISRSDNPKRHGNRLTHYYINKMLKRLAKRAEIEKEIWFHLLRHSQATESAKYLTRAEMCVKFGWSKSSDMPERYTHLSQIDIQRKEKEKRGLIKETEMVRATAPKVCPRCNATNTQQAKLCSSCFYPLDKHTAEQVMLKEKVLNKLLDNPKVKEALEEAIKNALNP